MSKRQTATFAGGCFWCTEAIFQRLKGVSSVTPGYAGGEVENPSYEDVVAGGTGHAEAVQIEFDPDKITYETLLDVFWHTHDPTTPNRQGNDVGNQYRSVIFYRNEKQKKIAEKSKYKLEKDGVYQNPMVTEIIPFTKFYEAEDYHKNYYENHPGKMYCSIVISPKIQKLLGKYGNLAKEEYVAH